LTCDIHPPETPRKIHSRPLSTNLPATRRTRRTNTSAHRRHLRMVRRDNEREFIAESEKDPNKEQTVPDETRHESADLDDYSVQEPADSLTGEPGEPGNDPLDRGVAPPERWSAVIRSGSDGGEQESLDELLGEEEPDTALDLDDELPEDREDDDEADEYLDGLLLDDGPDPRAGRLVAEDEGAHSDDEEDLVATDVGIDGGAASAEEAAIHVVEDDDTDIRSGD